MHNITKFLQQFHYLNTCRLLQIHAVAAHAVILYGMPLNPPGKCFLGLCIDKIFIFHMNVQKTMAFPAYKMGMRLYMSIKAVRAIGSDLDNLS